MGKSKKERKAELEAIKERFRAFRRGMREDEIADHNGKPFTSKNLPALKNKYNRKRKEWQNDY